MAHWGLTSVPGKLGRVPQVGDRDHQSENDMAALGRRPLCLLPVCGFQLRAAGE